MKTMRLIFFLLLLAPVTGARAEEEPSVAVKGDLPRTGSMRQEELEALGAITASWQEHGTAHEVTGVPLEKVITAFGFTAGPMGKSVPPATKRAGLRKVVVAVASDGYQIAFSCGEIFPEVGTTRALVVWKMDGKPLAKGTGPLRLAVLTDHGGDRSVQKLSRLVVVDVTQRP